MTEERQEKNRINNGNIALFISLAFGERPRLINLFWAKVLKTETCWICVSIRYKGRSICLRAHRVSWTLANGLSDLPFDHLCKNKACVNPAHLEPVTTRVNNLRSDSISGLNSRKTQCSRGHLFTAENTRTIPGGRSCKKCERLATKAWRIANPERNREQRVRDWKQQNEKRKLKRRQK